MLEAKQILLERYQLIQSLGQNAGRQTWLAQDCTENPPQRVIVKLLAFSPQMEWDEFKLFEREGQILQTLNHPRIPQYRDYFSLDGQRGEGLCWFGLVQDYIPGASIQQLLNDGQRFTETQVRSIATQVLNILIYLHGLNPPVLHRDIKPGNLILAEDEQIYLVDFGAVADPTAVEGATFTVVGTAGYAPLEQFYGKAVPASDLYALGATLIHLLTGTTPADLPQSNLRIHFQNQVSLNSTFLRWIESLTEPDLERRFSSADRAMTGLKTGSLLQTNFQPAGSRIRLKKSASKLVIKIPRYHRSLKKRIHLSCQWLLALGARLVLLLPSLISLGISAWVVYGILSGNIFGAALIIPFILIPLMVWFWRKNKRANQEGNWHELTEHCLGINYLVFRRDNFVIKPPILLSFSSNRYRVQPISDIEAIEVISDEGIAIKTRKYKYILGEGLRETEQEWLVEEIQDWLYMRSCTSRDNPTENKFSVS